MSKVSRLSVMCIRNMTIATWQKRVSAEDAFYKIYENEQDISDETAADIQQVLEFAASHRYTIEDAVEEIIELIEDE